jgi:NADPH:quinone reductase-like Zn-dependent oxidoreductase
MLSSIGIRMVFDAALWEGECDVHAAVVHLPGGPEAIGFEDLPLREIPPGWVRIQVKAIGLSRSELYARRGEYPEVAFPRVLGTECVGIIDALSDDSSEPALAALQPGTIVVALMGGMGRLYDGCYAEYVVAPATHVLPLSTMVSWNVLAAVPKSYLTAYQAIETLDLDAGQSLLIRGGTSSVGMCALTLAKERGALVFATTRIPSKVEALYAAGADTVILDSGTIEAEIQQVVPGGVSAVLELIGAATLRDSLLAVTSKGILCYMGSLGDQSVLERFQPLADIPSGVRLTSYASRVTIDAAHCTQVLQQIVDGVADGRYPTHLDRVFSFHQLVEAHRYMEDNRATGKVVVSMP